MKYYFVLLLCLVSTVNAQHITKLCKTCGRPFSECSYKGVHPVKVNDQKTNVSDAESSKKDAIQLTKAKQFYIEYNFCKAKECLDKVKEHTSDYYLLAGDIDYLYGEDTWRTRYQKAASLGNTDAQNKINNFLIERRLSRTVYTSSPKTEAERIASSVNDIDPWDNNENSKVWFSQSLKAAQMGYWSAKKNIAKAYLYGWGTPIDYEKSFYWWKEVGDDLYLSWFYSNGIYVEKDEQKAFELTRKYVNGIEAVNCALCYEFGKGTKINYEEAMSRYVKVIDDKYSKLHLDLSYSVALERYCYLTCIKNVSDTIDMDGRSYYNIYTGMKKQANSEFISDKDKQLYLRASDKYFKLACQKEIIDDEILVDIGNIFQEKKEYSSAFDFYNRAVELSGKYCKYACWNIGHCYEHGLGVIKDYAKAKIWYVKALELGHSWVQDDIKRLTKKGY